MGSLGQPMGAFRLKSRFWSDSIAYAIERFVQGSRKAEPSTLSFSPKRKFIQKRVNVRELYKLRVRLRLRPGGPDLGLEA